MKESINYENNEQRKKSLANEIESLKHVIEMKEKHLKHLKKNRNGDMIMVKNPLFVKENTRAFNLVLPTELQEVEPEIILEDVFWNEEEFVNSPLEYT